MTICRRHPAFGWLALQGHDTQKTLNTLLNHRDKALQVDPTHSGMPQSFIDWCWEEQLPSLLRVPFYRQQIEQHVQDLKDKSDRLAEQVYRQAGSLIAEQSNVDSERHQLAEMLQGEP